MASLLSEQPKIDLRSQNDIALLHKLECRACPLNTAVGGKMPPTGSNTPLVYVIGEAPGAEEVERQEQFVGASGQVLRPLIPPKFLHRVRFNNVVRSRPPKNATPDTTIIECFPAGTAVVAVGGTLGAYRRLYVGELVRVKTASGKELAGSPNHPIFTVGGRKPLGSLKKGDYVFRTLRGDVGAFGINPDHNNGPTGIEKVFSSLSMSKRVERRKEAVNDFHGDGRVGEVEVVGSDGFLRDGFDSSLTQKLLEKELFGAYGPRKISLERQGSFDVHFGGKPKASIPSVALRSFCCAMQRIPGFSSFKDVADFYAVSLKKALDSLIPHFFKTREFREAVSPSVKFNKIILRGPEKAVPPMWERNSFAFEEFSDSTVVDTVPSGELHTTGGLLIESDPIESVEYIRDFRGHVYNLSTESGAYFAGGILVSNCCRPSIVRDIEKTKPRAILGFGNVPLEWVSNFSGVTMWRGRRMPVRVGSHVCWYYPMLHPAYLLRNRRNGRPSEDERMFAFDMKRAFAEIERLPAPEVHTVEDVRRGVEIIIAPGKAGVAQVAQALRWAAQQPVIGFDYETNGLRPFKANAKVLSIAVGTRERAFAFPYEHPEASWSAEERAHIKQLWVAFLKTAKGVKAAHNLAFEMEWTAFFFGPELLRAGNYADTATEAVILDERSGARQGSKRTGGPLSLEFLVQQYFGFNLKKLAGVDRANLENTPIEAVLYYNAPDARYAALLHEEQSAEIEYQTLQEAYELAIRVVPTVILTQLKGLPVDQVEVSRLSGKYEKLVAETEKAIEALPVVKEFKKLKGAGFKPLSNPDVLYVLRDMLHRKEVLVQDKYSKETKYSADKNILDQIDHPIAGLITKLREYNKRLSTYIEPLKPDSAVSVLWPDGLLHPQFNTLFAETARLSSDSPNAQNFPKRDGEAKEVRKPICAPPGHLMLAFDMGQIEARVIAMATKDNKFTKALWERYDVHMEWAERIAHAYPARVGGKKNLIDKKVMKDFRTDVKNQFTFPLFFGARLESAAGYLHIPPENLKPVYNAFWREFSGVKAWQERLVEFYNEHGYVECLTGRRRRGPLSLNQILNSPVQGTAAAIVLDIMARLSETGDPNLQPELNIHDDLTWIRVPENQVDAFAERILPIMLKPNFSWINVPLTVEGALGKNWLEMEEFGQFSSDEWGFHK